MNELIKDLFKCATNRIITNPLLTKIINDIDLAIQERNINLNSESGELWQQLQDFKRD